MTIEIGTRVVCKDCLNDSWQSRRFMGTITEILSDSTYSVEWDKRWHKGSTITITGIEV